MEITAQNVTDVNGGSHKSCIKTESPDLKGSLLWKLHMRRKEAFEEMNSDVDEVVNQCLNAKRNLEALEDNNRDLKKEARSLRTKYEALLEKNKKDTGIIMRLKDSELMLRQVIKNHEETSESLLKAHLKNKEKTLERKLLQDSRQKLLLKSQTITNTLRKINLKHKRIYEQIEDETKTGKDNENLLTHEIKELKSNINKNDFILEEWLKNNTIRDTAIRKIQDEMKVGLMIQSEPGVEDLTSEKASEVDTGTIETTEQSVVEETAVKESEKIENEETDHQEKFRREWMRKKTLWEATERHKEHWMDFYMLLNRRMQDLSIKIVNVRQWYIDKEAERGELVEKVGKMEELVSQKRRKKPIPQRSSIEEMNMWIKVQLQANEKLREVISRCLTIKVEDTEMYSEFAKSIRDMYKGTLKEQPCLESENEKQTSEDAHITQTENNA